MLAGSGQRIRDERILTRIAERDVQATLLGFGDQCGDYFTRAVQHRPARAVVRMAADAGGMAIVIGEEFLNVLQADRSELLVDERPQPIQSRKRIGQAKLPVRVASMLGTQEVIRVNQKSQLADVYERPLTGEFDIENRPAAIRQHVIAVRAHGKLSHQLQHLDERPLFQNQPLERVM